MRATMLPASVLVEALRDHGGMIYELDVAGRTRFWLLDASGAPIGRTSGASWDAAARELGARSFARTQDDEGRFSYTYVCPATETK